MTSLKPLLRLGVPAVLTSLCVLVGIWVFALLSGLSPSVARAAFMFSLMTVGKAVKRQPGIYNVLAISAFFLLFINPMNVFQLGFLLSYLAVLGIAALYPLLTAQFTFRQLILQKIWELTAVTTVAQLATFPLAVHAFHMFPNYFLPANFIAIPATTFFIICGTLTIVLSVWSFFSSMLACLLDLTMACFFDLMEGITELPGAVSHFHLDFAGVVLLYGIISLIAYAAHTGNKRPLFIAAFMATCWSATGLIGDILYNTFPRYALVNVHRNPALLQFKGQRLCVYPLVPSFDSTEFHKVYEGFLVESGIRHWKVLDETVPMENRHAGGSLISVALGDLQLLVVHTEGWKQTIDSLAPFVRKANIILWNGPCKQGMMEKMEKENTAAEHMVNLYERGLSREKWCEPVINGRAHRLAYNDYLILPGPSEE